MPRTPLQPISSNKHAITDLVSSSLPSTKRIRLASPSSIPPTKRIRLASPVRNIRGRKPSTSCVPAKPSVDIRPIQSAIIRCEPLKKRRGRHPKNEADIIKQKPTVAEKKRRGRPVKSNAAQNIQNKEEKHNPSIKSVELATWPLTSRAQALSPIAHYIVISPLL